MTITSKKYCIQYIVQTRSVLGRLHVRNVLMDLYAACGGALVGGLVVLLVARLP